MKRIGITGGSGFIGGHLASALAVKGYEVVIFSRNPSRNSYGPYKYALLNAEKNECDIAAISGLRAIVNLAGAGIADKRWTDGRKKEIVDSRIGGTNFLVSKLKEHGKHCTTFIGASAMGFYGPDREGSLPFTEDDPHYPDFLGNTCMEWEAASLKAGAFARTAITRFGIVLGKESGAFPKFVKPLSFGVRPILGRGKQIISWIHIDDLVQMIVFVLEHEAVSGIYNAVAPNPVSNRELMDTIASVKGGLNVPIHVPSLVLKVLLGEMSTEVLKSCTVSAQKILQAGFTFQYTHVNGAVKSLFSS